MKKYQFPFFLLNFIFVISNTMYSISFDKKIKLTKSSNLSLIEIKQQYELLEGNYTLFIDKKNYAMSITVTCNKPNATIKFNNTKILSEFSFKNGIVNISIKENGIHKKLIGKLINNAGVMQGVSNDNNGKKSIWSAAKLITENRAKNRILKKTN